MLNFLNTCHLSILPMRNGSFFLEIQDIQEDIQLHN